MRTDTGGKWKSTYAQGFTTLRYRKRNGLLLSRLICFEIDQKQPKRGPGRPIQTKEEKYRKLIEKNKDKSNNFRKLTDSFLFKI